LEGEKRLAVRRLLLTIVLTGAPLLLLAAGPGYLGRVVGYRLLATWGIPLAIGVLAVLICSGAPSLASAGKPRRGVVRLLPWCLAAFVADHAFLAIARLSGWATFTFGDQGLSGHPLRAALWGLPLCLALGIVGWEAGLRRILLVAWMRDVPRPVAVMIACGTGTLLAAPTILSGFVNPDTNYVVAAFLSALCREVSFSLVFLAGGGLLLAGLYRGCLFYVDAFVVQDWYGVYFPAANYVSSDPVFYMARGASALLAASIIGLGAWRASR
jgi:hypothetical protein